MRMRSFRRVLLFERQVTDADESQKEERQSCYQMAFM